MAAETAKCDESINRNGQPGWASHPAVPQGLNEAVIRRISAGNDEPDFMLDWRLQAYRHWLSMAEPAWSTLHHPPIDYQAIRYDPESREEPAGVAAADAPPPEGELPPGIALDAVLGRYSAAAFKAQLAKLGIILCSLPEAVREHPALVRQYLGSVVPPTDNFFASLNAAVFADGSFCYIPPGVCCPIELSAHFRSHAVHAGHFERTLIVADRDSTVSYLENSAAPGDGNRLHAGVVELVALENARIRYATVQNGYRGDGNGQGGIYNFVTQRGECRGDRSRISWTQVDTGSAITWKYPSVVLRGDHTRGEFRAVTLTNHDQQVDGGAKMIHLGRNTRSSIVAKGIAAGNGHNAYRGLVKVAKSAIGARNRTQCHSLLLGDQCAAHTFPYIEVRHPSARVEHEASAARIGADQLFYCRSRGLSTDDVLAMIVNGFCKEVLQELPMEFAIEAQKLLAAGLAGGID
ncbi:Fe-S cluster assembly protein SufB [Dechloromonas sp. XY25]|uniref:Fe-S cluster assembly protein SufB n=1 Tax=Dechloromonas hankyongensis TaxID=2908002 RepID=A0ABS9K679_9RHOO|nr:Fe-S cluster assembly protein SufB [Dechloromonas hankyongensis]MCG2578682.1 Fe-S cluster assembly protein SufB [Dechloromonas hankyongensis]